MLLGLEKSVNLQSVSNLKNDDEMHALFIIPQTALELNGVLTSCQKRSLFHHGPGSSWFRLGFGCLSPFFSLLSFPGKGFCSIMILLVPARVPVLVSLSSLFFLFSGKRLCPVSSWFRLWCRCLSPFFSLLSFLRTWNLFHHWFLLVPAQVPVLVSLLLSSCFSQEWFRGFSWFRLWFRCLSPFFSLLSFLRKGVLFHHDVLVPFGSGSGSGACFPCSLFFFSPEWRSLPPWFPGSWWFRLWCRCSSPFFFLLPFLRNWCSVSWFRLGFRCLSPFFSLLSFLRKRVLFHHDLLVAPGSGSGSGGCLPSSLFFFSRKRVLFHHDVLVPLGSGSGSGACLPSFFCQEEGFVPF